MGRTAPEAVAIASNPPDSVEGDSVDSAFIVQQLEGKVIVWGEEKVRVFDLDDLILDPIIVANLKIGGGEHFIPADTVEQILDRLHVLASTPFTIILSTLKSFAGAASLLLESESHNSG